MPYTLKDFVRDWIQEHADEIVAQLPPEQRIQGLSPEQRIQGLSPEVLEQLLNDLRKMQSAPGKAKPTKKKSKGRAKPDRE